MKRSLKIGIIFSCMYLAAVITSGLIIPNKPLLLNEWGDYFAGSISPLALAWFVGTLIMQAREISLQREVLENQREELSLQRKEMEASREALEQQVLHQRATADALADSAKIAGSQGFHNRVIETRNQLTSIIDRLAGHSRSFTITTNSRNLSTGSPHKGADLSEWVSFLKLILQSEDTLKQFEEQLSSTERFRSLAREYVMRFQELREEAYRTNNLHYITEDFGVINGLLQVAARLAEE